MHDRIIKEKRKWLKKRRNTTLGWKLEKGSLEQKWENFQRLTGRANKRMKSQQPGSIWSLHGFLNHFQNQKIWTFYSKSVFLEFLSLSRWVLTPVKLSYSKTSKKWILLRCLIFKKIIFPKEGLGNVPPLCPTKLWKWIFWARSLDFRVNISSGDF